MDLLEWKNDCICKQFELYKATWRSKRNGKLGCRNFPEIKFAAQNITHAQFAESSQKFT